MVFPVNLLAAGLASLASTALGAASADVDLTTRAPRDPCAVIGGKKWVAPQDVRACYESARVDETIKSNIIEVINKTLAFHTSTNYQIRAPAPFSNDVHEDVLADLARIKRQKYRSDYDLHIDLSRTLKRLNDGHCVWINSCYNVHIALEAFDVASAEFPDQIDVWQNALPGQLKGKLASLNGAKVLRINGKPPFDAVNANTLITGGYQAFGTRQNAFFSSYQRAAAGWNYIMGNFAQQSLPLSDSVALTIQRVGQTRADTITLPYRSRIGSAAKSFTDAASWRANNCVAVAGTNGVDVYDPSASRLVPAVSPVQIYQQQPIITNPSSRKQPMNVLLDDAPLTNVVLPPTLQPSLSPVAGSRNAAQFYLRDDGKTGVLALGSFSDADYTSFLNTLLQGLLSLKAQGATHLIVDVTNNGGGYICAAHYLHRIIIGPKSSTVPQAGLDTTARAGPLAQNIVKSIIATHGDPDLQLLYNPLQWRAADNEFFSEDEDWLQPPVELVINGRHDAFSQRLGQECQPEGFPTPPPEEGLFDPKNVVIVSNGRCASSCSLFSITMSKHEGVKTVVVGGKKDVPQQYCGIVGGQSTDFSTIDTEIKTAHLKNNTLAPPDLLVNGIQGITWRLAFGIDDPEEPEEWQNHPADLNLPLTSELVNNPEAIWAEVAKRFFS